MDTLCALLLMLNVDGLSEDQPLSDCLLVENRQISLAKGSQNVHTAWTV
jgi:hypothetical protein